MNIEMEAYGEEAESANLSPESTPRVPTPLPRESEADVPTPSALSTTEIMAMLAEGDESIGTPLAPLEVSDALISSATVLPTEEIRFDYDIDLKELNVSLSSINPRLWRRMNEKHNPIQLLEFHKNGTSRYQSFMLREFYYYINRLCIRCDVAYDEARERPKRAFEMDLSGWDMRIRRKENNLEKHPQRHGVAGDLFTSKAAATSFTTSIATRHHAKRTAHISYSTLKDIRTLDFQFTPQEDPSLFVRRHAVIISIDPLRAVVMSDRMLLLVPEGADTLIDLVNKQFQQWIGDGTDENNAGDDIFSVNIPFEARAYEALFGTSIEIQKLEYQKLSQKIAKLQTRLKKASIIPVKVNEQMRQLKDGVTRRMERVKECMDVIDELLEDDEDMALMNLTLLKKKPHLYNAPLVPEILTTHEGIEVLLESFLMDYNSLHSKLNILRSQLDSTEDLVLLRLDTSRNRLLIADTAVLVVTCAFGFGGYIAALYGMNVRNDLENDDYAFVQVVYVTCASVAVGIFLVLLYLKQKNILPW